MRRVALVIALVIASALAGCSEDFFDPTPGATGPLERRVELIGANIRILPGEAGAIRIGFEPRDVSVHVRIDRPSPDGRIVACPLTGIDAPIPAESTCLPDLPNGVREGLTLAGLGGLALVREGGPMTLRIRIDFEEEQRAVAFRFPIIERPAGESVCKDNGCNPFFELTPLRGGAFSASASWTGGTGRLEVLEGRVLARSFSSTGIPYRTADQESGEGPLSVAANLNAPSEYALALLNTSAGNLTNVRLEATWP